MKIVCSRTIRIRPTGSLREQFYLLRDLIPLMKDRHRVCIARSRTTVYSGSIVERREGVFWAFLG